MTKSEQLGSVLIDEAKRQGRSPRSVGQAVGNKNVLYKVKAGKDIFVSTFLGIADELGVPAHELLYRLERP